MSSPFAPDGTDLTRALFIPADPAKPVRDVFVACEYPQLPQVIGADLFELLHVPDTELYLVVDEEGFLRRRPANPRASRLARCHLVGDVLVLRDGGEDLISLTAEDLAQLAAALA